MCQPRNIAPACSPGCGGPVRLDVEMWLENRGKKQDWERETLGRAGPGAGRCWAGSCAALGTAVEKGTGWSCWWVHGCLYLGTS